MVCLIDSCTFTHTHALSDMNTHKDKAMEATEEQQRQRLHGHCLVWIKCTDEAREQRQSENKHMHTMTCTNKNNNNDCAVERVSVNVLTVSMTADERDRVIQKTVISREKMIAALQWLIEHDIWCEEMFCCQDETPAWAEAA